MICKECGQTIPSKRSVKQNSFRWAVVHWLFTHDTHEIRNEELYHNWLKVEAQWVDPLTDRSGNVIGFIPRKTDFKHMPQDVFNQYLNDINDVVWEKVLPNHDSAFEQEWCNLTRVFSGG